jgi:predicted nucleic acid-binding protein
MQLAAAGQAQALVSGDQDLLAIAVEFERATGCPMWSLEDFLSNALFAIHK